MNLLLLLLMPGGTPLDFPSSSVVKNSSAMQDMQEMWVQSLDLEDPLEEGMATHSSILARKIPGTEESHGLQSMGSQRVRHNCTCKREVMFS